MRGARVSRHVELLLWIVAVVCFALLLHARLGAAGALQAAAQISTPHLTDTPPVRASPQPSPAGAAEGTVIGRMEMPQLSLVVPILSTFEPDSLRRGVGHIPGTAFPGGLGTVGLAGHRDTYFRPLRHITAGMEIRLIDNGGLFHYVVDSTEIVQPEQVEVLAIRNRPELTLVTCYPFEFVGQAPLRFIVHAHLLSLAPDPSPSPP